MKLLLLAILSLAPINAEIFRYDNYTLFRLEPETTEQYEVLKYLYENNEYDFWTPPNDNIDYVSVVSSPELKENFINLLKTYEIKSEVTVENIQEAFDEQHPRRHKRDASRDLYWSNYQILEEIYDWFDVLASTHPDVVTVIVAGHSYEGREIKGVRISRTSGRRAFFLEGGMIGADWLSPVTLTYAINQLVTSEDPETRQASLDYDWYIVPVTNPDGYEFSQDAVRLWTKNRRPTAGVVPTGFVGVDLTKNWNSYWGVVGANFNPASNTYPGHGPFSEIETRTLSSYIETVPRLYAFLSFRAIGHRLVIPFAHTSEPMYNYDDMILVGRRSVGSLAARYGTMYLVGNSVQVLDGATGATADWVKHRFNPPIVFTIHMRDSGTWGYTLPVSQILPNCEEVFDGLLAIVREGRYAIPSIVVVY